MIRKKKNYLVMIILFLETCTLIPTPVVFSFLFSFSHFDHLGAAGSDWVLPGFMVFDNYLFHISSIHFLV